MTDWALNALDLRNLRKNIGPMGCPALSTAIALCERMARGELVEREHQWATTGGIGNCVVCGSDNERDGCAPLRVAEPRQTAPVAERQHPIEDERAHCEALSQELFLIPVPQRVEILLRERAATRAAGDKAGYERGRKERDAVLTKYLEQQDKIDDMATQVHEFNDRCKAGVAGCEAKLNALQSQHESALNERDAAHDALEVLQSRHEALVAAARAYRKDKVRS